MISNLLRKAASMLALLLLGHGAAQAGLVTGRWDPPFGGTLTNLSWQVRSDWLVPNGCPNAPLGDGVYSTSAPGGPCESTPLDPVRLLGVWVRWFNTDAGDPNDFFQGVSSISAPLSFCETNYATVNPDCNLVNPFTFSLGNEPLVATKVRVEQQQVVGFDTNVTSFLTSGNPSSAGIHIFDLSLTVNGPVFTCRNATDTNFPVTPPTDTRCDTPQTSTNSGLDQFLVTYTSNDKSKPKFTDANGNALGAVLGSTGKYLGQRAVPEPGALSLAVAALAMLGVMRRRRC